MDETYLTHLFGSPGNELQSVKVIRNKQTGFSEGYGFVDFASNAAAQRVLHASILVSRDYTHACTPNFEQLYISWQE